MDEKLKKKLELLGKPALPESLSAEALFRRMDSGELTLPEGSEAGAAPSGGKVIPWAKILRRGLPIAACLALVVFISQGGIHWRMGSSGGNLSAPAAPQKAADQGAPILDGGAPIESYSSDADEEAPDPAPWAIAIEDNAETEEAAEDAAPDLGRQGGTKNGPQDFAESSDSAADAFAPGDGPDIGGAPTGGGTVSAAPSPDLGSENDDDPDNANPDTGGPGEDDEGHSLADQLWELLEGIISDLFGKEDDLAGLTPGAWEYWVGPSAKGMGGPLEVEATVLCHLGDDQGEIVSLVTLQCTAIWSEEQQKYTMQLNAWEIGPAPTIDDAGDAFENPDTSEMPPWDPDSDPAYGKNPDVGAKSQEGSGIGEAQEEPAAGEAQGEPAVDEDQEEPEEEPSLQLFPSDEPDGG